MILVYVPCLDEEEAQRIGNALVSEKYAHCVNIIPEIRSIYREKKEVKQSSEALLLVKTNERFPAVREFIKKHHSYKTPAILCVNFDKVNEEYLDWSVQP
jgi:periplasmic divalent cation tolerance protein